MPFGKHEPIMPLHQLQIQKSVYPDSRPNNLFFIFNEILFSNLEFYSFLLSFTTIKDCIVSVKIKFQNRVFIIFTRFEAS